MCSVGNKEKSREPTAFNLNTPIRGTDLFSTSAYVDERWQCCGVSQIALYLMKLNFQNFSACMNNDLYGVYRHGADAGMCEGGRGRGGCCLLKVDAKSG